MPQRALVCQPATRPGHHCGLETPLQRAATAFLAGLPYAGRIRCQSSNSGRISTWTLLTKKWHYARGQVIRSLIRAKEPTANYSSLDSTCASNVMSPVVMEGANSIEHHGEAVVARGNDPGGER